MPIVINVFSNHKFGSSWTYNLLRDFSRMNSFPFHSSNRGWWILSLGPDLEQAVAFYRNATYEVVSSACSSGVRLIRDPRSVVCSAYFSHLNTHRISDWGQLRRQRKLLGSYDVAAGMRLTLAFLERSDFYHGTVGPLNALSQWNFEDSRYTTLRAEDFFSSPRQYLQKIVSANGLSPDNFEYPDDTDYSFDAISGRQAGDVDNQSHYRSGVVDWQTHLPKDVISYLEAHYWRVINEFYSE